MNFYKSRSLPPLWPRIGLIKAKLTLVKVDVKYTIAMVTFDRA